MHTTERLGRLPTNFSEFVEENADGVGGLYGPSAALEYRETVVERMSRALIHPTVTAWSVPRGGADSAGIILSVRRHDVGYVSFHHVLKGHGGEGIEGALVRTAVEDLRAGGVKGIVSECVPFCALDVDETYRELGFEAAARGIFLADLARTDSTGKERGSSRAVSPVDYPAMARLIVEAYRDHPGRWLHGEVQTLQGALDFVHNAASGAYGASLAGFSRVVEEEGRVVGALVGCRVAPDTGFILQVVVHPGRRGRGLGTVMLEDVAGAFRSAGLERAALGVTLDNPARRLYERLGYGMARPVTAHGWWRE